MTRIRPKNRVNSKLVHLVDQDDEVVAEHLSQCLVDLGPVMSRNILAELDAKAGIYCAARQERDVAATELDKCRRRIDVLLAELRRKIVDGT